jgi:hypothetical protein
MFEATDAISVLFRQLVGKGSNITIDAPLRTNAFRIKQKFEADHPEFIGIISVDVTDSQKLQVSCLTDNADIADKGRETLLATINSLRTNPLTDRFYEER